MKYFMLHSQLKVSKNVKNCELQDYYYMMASLCVVCDWEDGFSGVISLKCIQQPRKDFKDYVEGEEVQVYF